MEDEIVCKWDAIREQLLGSIKSKARRFCKEKCVEWLGGDLYLVKHIPGYNKTDYTVDIKQGTCNCQYNNKGLKCSHLAAVALYRATRESSGSEGLESSQKKLFEAL